MADADLTMRLAVIAMLARAALVLQVAGAAGLLALGAWVAADALAYRRRVECIRERGTNHA